MLFLSLCMIVKNEENVLKRCLDSVKGIVDEIVIADTGSTDNTVKIASEYTDHIYEYEWTDSFSDARNFVQKKASGKWILVLDADEYVDRDNLIAVKEKLIKMVETIDTVFTTIYNFTGQNGEYIAQHKSIRIYINDPVIKFIRTIHEQLKRENAEFTSDISDLIIYHSGYLKNTVKKKDKNLRNTRLIKKQTKKTGYTGFDYFNMANEFLSSQETQKALKYYQKAYLLKSDISFEWVPQTVVQIVLCLMVLKRDKEALKVIEDGEGFWNNAPEFKYLKGQIFLNQNRLEDAKEQFNLLLQNKNEYKAFIKSIDYVELYPYMSMGYIYEKERNVSMAIESYTYVLSNNSDSINAFHKLITILAKNCSQEEILGFIKTQRLSDGKNQLGLIKILLDLSKYELSEILINHLDSSLKIKNGMLLKLKMIKDDYPVVINYFNNLSDDDLNHILNEGFFDWIDLFLLYLLKKDLTVFSRIKKGISDVGIVAFLQKGDIKGEADKNMYLALLERSIKYQWFDLFEDMLSKKEYIDSSVDLAIGHLLCKYDFYEIALSLYEQVGDIKLLDEAAFVNISEALIKMGDNENALEYAIQGIELSYKDFRLFKCAIELSIEMDKVDIKEEILKLALKYYPDSNWLKNMCKLM